MKRLLTFLLALVMVVSAVPAAFATEPEETTGETEIVRAPDECGDGITWEFDGGVLYIRHGQVAGGKSFRRRFFF